MRADPAAADQAGPDEAVIFVFIPILGEYLAPQLVGGARGVMIGNLIVNFFSGRRSTRAGPRRRS